MGQRKVVIAYRTADWMAEKFGESKLTSGGVEVSILKFQNM